MSEKRLHEIFLTLPDLNLPTKSGMVAWAQVMEVTSIDLGGMRELIELGWVQPVRTAAEQYLFKPRDVYRIQKLMRLCHDLDVSYMGGSIIVDLLDRIELMEKRIAELEGLI